MGIGKGNFTARKGGYRAGYGIVMDLAADLPRKFDGDAVAKGMVLTGSVVSVLGLTRLITRTEGPQYRGLMSIPSPAFPDADKIVFKASDKPVEAQDGEEAQPAGE